VLGETGCATLQKITTAARLLTVVS